VCGRLLTLNPLDMLMFPLSKEQAQKVDERVMATELLGEVDDSLGRALGHELNNCALKTGATSVDVLCSSTDKLMPVMQHLTEAAPRITPQLIEVQTEFVHSEGSIKELQKQFGSDLLFEPAPLIAVAVPVAAHEFDTLLTLEQLLDPQTPEHQAIYDSLLGRGVEGDRCYLDTRQLARKRSLLAIQILTDLVIPSTLPTVIATRANAPQQILLTVHALSKVTRVELRCLQYVVISKSPLLTLEDGTEEIFFFDCIEQAAIKWFENEESDGALAEGIQLMKHIASLHKIVDDKLLLQPLQLLHDVDVDACGVALLFLQLLIGRVFTLEDQTAMRKYWTTYKVSGATICAPEIRCWIFADLLCADYARCRVVNMAWSGRAWRAGCTIVLLQSTKVRIGASSWRWC